MKIALISTPFFGVPPAGYSGLEQIVWDLACALTEIGHKVVIFAPGNKNPPKGFLYKTGEPINKVEVNWLEKELEMYNIYKDKLDGFDIINGHDWFGCEYLYKSEHPEAHVLHCHHGGLLWRSKPPNVENPNLISISKWMQKVYASQGFESRVCYDGVDTSLYKFSTDRESRLLFVGRLSTLKRPDIAIEVAKRAGTKIDILGGTFVPDQGYVQQIKHLCEANGFGFYPDAPHEKKLELMQEARCILVPSSFGEPCGLTPIEFMSTGGAAIVWDDGALKEIVEDGITGFVVPKTVEAMVEAVKKVDSIKPEECRHRVESNFSRKIMARNYVEKCYEPILRGEEW